MGHLSLQKPHRRLRERLDMHPIGCPETPGIIELLEAIFTPEQAAFVCTLPMKFFPIREACRRSGLSRKRAQELLDGLCDLGVVLDFERKGRRLYVVAPTLTGFLEFLFMRRRKNIDQPSLAVMMDKYLHQNVGIFRDMIGNVSMGRALVHEEKVLPRDYTEVLDYEKASFLIGEAKAVAVGLCYCRHVAEHNGKACENEQDVCMTLGTPARALARHGIARLIEKGEALDILKRCKEAGLVQTADNVKNKPSYICHCCGCCCGQLVAVRRARAAHPIQTSCFIAKIDEDKCKGCGRCVRSCPVNALSLVARVTHEKKKKYVAKVDGSFCLGCSVCAAACRNDALAMHRREQKVIYPEDMFDRLVLQAVDTGKLQHLIFDNPEQWYGKAASRLVGSILGLEPSKRILASKQVRSAVLSGLMKGDATTQLLKKLF